jgi:energy-coupling factor transporter ATP-binding protein EcfA2
MPIVKLRQVTYHYPLTPTPALQDIDLDIEEGEFVAIIGPNGAGKSTLCYTLAGFIPHFYKGELHGTVEVDGDNAQHSNLSDWVMKVGLVFQNPFNQISGAKYTVFEEVAFGLENLGVPRAEIIRRVEEVLERIGIADLADRSPYSLSGGQQQRMFIARALAQEAELMLMDEPFTGLDVPAQEELFRILDSLRTQGVTVMVALHDLQTASERFDRVMLLNRRLIGLGSAEQIFTPEHLIAAYGGHLRLIPSQQGFIALGDTCCDEGEHDHL